MAFMSFLRGVADRVPEGMSNVLQAIGGGAPVQQTPPLVEAAEPNFLQRLSASMSPQPAAAMPQPSAPVSLARPQQRRSMLSRFGELADGLASIAGATPGYQSALDRRQAREQADIKLEQDRLGMALKGYQAMIDNGTPADQAMAQLPQLLQAVNMEPEAAERYVGAFQQNPAALQGMLGLTGVSRDPAKHGMNVYYAQDANGNTFAYTVNERGGISRLNLGEGFSPALPVQAVDANGQTVLINRLSGNTIGAPIAHTVAPDVVANNETRTNIARDGRDSRLTIARERNASAERIAETRAEAGASGKAPASQTAVAEAATPIVARLRDAAERLYASGGMTGTSSSPLDVAEAEVRERVPWLERATNPAGFSARQDINRLTTVGIPALLPLLGGLTIGGKNIDAAKELDTWKNAIMNAKDYPSAIRAIEGFEARIDDLLSQADAAPSPAPARPAPARTGNETPRRRPSNIRATPRASSAPTVSNW